METVTRRAYARAGLLGNPSDGYNGKTISFAIGQFWAESTLEASEQLIIETPAANRFESIGQLHQQASDQGYYGADRLLKAAIKRFYEHVDGRYSLHDQNFKLRFSSTIPRQVGLAGSSAIIMATLRGLMAWYEVPIPAYLLASLTLSVERELGIPAGLQDRVIQAYQGLVYMDFSKSKMQSEMGLSYGHYEPLAPDLLSNIYVAYASEAGQPTEVLHNDLRERFRRKDPIVLQAMDRFAELAEQGRTAISAANMGELSKLIDQNFDQRAAICQLHPLHSEMVERARTAGASAKFCGSGGAIVGVFKDATILQDLQQSLGKINCCVFEPTVVG